MDWDGKAAAFCRSVIGQFNSRTEVEGRKRGVNFGISLLVEEEAGAHWFTFECGEETHSFTVPKLFEENNTLFVQQNDVRRAVCPYFMRAEDRVVDYYAIMYRIILDDPSGIVSSGLIKKSSFLQQVIWSFGNNNTSTIIYNLQRAINEVVNNMPLHETMLNSFIMNRRLIIVDPVFFELQDPEERLAYQIEKNIKYFDRGWTSIGLSDNSLADKNYILTCSIRELTPFGMCFHNPQRNLYSTLGMKGDELPKIRSKSMQDLMDAGVTRKGWNLFTMFVDIPDVFEDQIMVDEIHATKNIKCEKRYQCFGTLKVEEGQKLKPNQTLSVSDKATIKKFDVECEEAVVERITESTSNVGGVKTKVHNVIVSYKRFFKDAMKITNTHGNKGVIRLKNLGYAVDPRDGSTRKIDVIASAKSIGKRKNFGQILEAIYNNLTGDSDEPVVVPNWYGVTRDHVKQRLREGGFPTDATWHCETYMGPLEGVCGEVFWGVIGTAEPSLWKDQVTTRMNARNLRTAGLKFSHVEMRALQTRFGKDNPITNEIMAYVQGGEDLNEEIKILKSREGELPEGVPEYDIYDLKFVNQDSGTIIDEEFIKGTVVDEHFAPDGFILKLPVSYQVIIDSNNAVEYEGIPTNDQPIIIDKIYIPKSIMRGCWQHSCGKFGLSEIGALVNNIVIIAYRFTGQPSEARHLSMLYRAIAAYFSRVARMMSTKTGELAQLGMAVRYPFSSKAKATLCNRLPENTVEIHESMADQLQVSNNDVVIAERFPCLGFMSVRPQKVRVTKDKMARYTIRVAGNSLCSMGLDFDGDDIYLASFHTPEAKKALRAEWENPNKECYEIIQQLNNKAGKPTTRCMGLDDYNITEFEPLTPETHAAIVSKATGVKSHTGPVIALAYNLMRILENSNICNMHATNVAVEYFLDRVGNTVFKQKHGVKSLHAIVTDAICTGNVDTLVEEGFDRGTSQMIVDVIVEKAAQVGVSNLRQYHEKAKKFGWSNVINKIVRAQNKIYYASRASLEAHDLLTHLDNPAVDIPSRMLKDTIAGRNGGKRTKLEEHLIKAGLSRISDADYRSACEELIRAVDTVLEPEASNEKTAIKARKCMESIIASVIQKGELIV